MEREVDLTSLEEVFRRDYGHLCRVAWILVGDQARAEELVMDAFARSIREWAKVQNTAAGSAYLRKAVVNRCRDYLRRRRTEWRSNALHAARTPQSEAFSGVDDEVFAAVRALPLRQRTVVVLTYFADLSETSVAAELGISVGTVKSQLSKARHTLAITLKEPA